MATASLTPGQVLSERYVVRRLIGLGTLAATYEAEDSTLQRPVAIRAFGRDVIVSDEWRDYFRSQVTTVASLHNPSLLRIYEWGETEEFVYLVTEYLAGGSLRDVLRARGRLSREQTAMIGLETASALAYAHARGMVHGAIRPSKILFDLDGRVRLADLGVAAALSRAPRPASTLEEARYLSPEQVLGEPVDGRSDVYSLSLVLYQCLTGEIAHDGPSAEAARTNRLGAPLPHRAELGPLDLALAIGAAPEAGARPDAGLLAQRLESVAATLPVPRPVTLSSENLGGFRVPSPDEVLMSPATASTARVMDATGEVAAVVRPLDLPGYRESAEAAAARSVAPPRRKSRSSAAAFVLTCIIVLALALGAAFAWRLGVFSAKYKVPNLVGLNYRSVASDPLTSHFTISVTKSQVSNVVPADDIISQLPKPGVPLRGGSTINIVISLGADTVPVPNVVGLTCAVATVELANVELRAACPTSAQVTSKTITKNGVVDVWNGSVKNPTTVVRGTTLTLAISTGPPTGSGGSTSTSSTSTTTTVPGHPARAVPNVVGATRAQTIAAMGQAELYFATYGPGSQNGSWSTVVSTSPAPGTLVPWHSTVRVTVK